MLVTNCIANYLRNRVATELFQNIIEKGDFLGGNVNKFPKFTNMYKKVGICKQKFHETEKNFTNITKKVIKMRKDHKIEEVHGFEKNISYFFLKVH